MRKQFFLVAVYALLVPAISTVHSQSLPWSSPHRLSLSLTSSYYFNPWNNYNDALAKVAHRIRLDPYFVEPEGFYEEIDGDLALQAALSYGVAGRVSARVTGQYGQSSSQFEFYPSPANPQERVFSSAFHQSLDWNFWAIGGGASYQFPLRRGLYLKASAGAEHYSAQLDLKWRYSYSANGPLSENEGVSVQAKLQDQSWGGNLAFAVQWQLAGPLALLAGASYNDFYLDNLPFTAELVEASNYFGLRMKEKQAGAYDIFLPPLTFLTSPDENARVPAKIDLNSSGL